MKRAKNSREYSLQHCQERARERYEFDLTEAQYDQICQRLDLHFTKPGATKFAVVNTEGKQVTMLIPITIPPLPRESGKRVAKRDSVLLVVVYDTEHKLLKTLLPPEQFMEHPN